MKLLAEPNDQRDFRQLLNSFRIRPARFENTLDRMEAVEVMSTICEQGDLVLALIGARKLSADAAETLLTDLAKCFADPLASTATLKRIMRHLQEHQR